MSFCEHCEGQRFDRAQVLRALRRAQQDIRTRISDKEIEAVFGLAIDIIRELDIPHLEPAESEVIH